MYADHRPEPVLLAKENYNANPTIPPMAP